MQSPPLKHKAMESLSSSSRTLPSHHPFLAHCFTQPRTTPQLHFPIKSPNHSHYKFLFHAASPVHRAPKNTLISAVAEATPAGGDLTGLVQNGALLLSIYWFANFVVPGLMSKDFEPVASETEKETEEEEEEEEAIHGGEMKQGTNVQANVKSKRRSRGMKKTASSR